MSLERYQIKRTIGTGGWGEVNLAIDSATGKRVAVKSISRELTPDESGIERETAALKALDHPGVVSFIDAFSGDGKFHIVTEYIEGKTLSEILEERQPSLETVGDYAQQIIAALAHIHSRGIIHSDLKPENIIINGDGRVTLIDFGIVRTASAEIASDIKEIRGTLHYMSPEQADGQPYDVRSDIFSLGVILYEMCCGKKPFTGEYDMAVIYSILYEDPVAPEKLNNAVSRGLSAAIMKMLAKDPGERPGSSEDVAKILEGVFATRESDDDAPLKEIAILPFEHPEGDDESRAVAEGLYDEIHTRLQQLDNLHMISPIKVARFGGRLSDGAAVRNLLGADNYLTGRIHRLGTQLRIYLMFLKCDGDEVIWSDKFDNPISDLFGIIDGITEKVVTRFEDRTEITDRLIPSRGASVKPEAYELFLLARGYYVKNTREDVAYARNMYREALKLDPQYAMAMVGIADCYCQDYMNYIDRSPRIIAQAVEWAERALEIAGNLPEAYRSLGRIMHATGKLSEATRYYLKAVTYKEDYYLAHRSLGWIHADMFKYDEALAWVRKSLSINSTDLETIFLQGFIHYDLKNSRQAINHFTRCLELRPDYGRAHYGRAITHFQMGHIDDAISELKQTLRLGGDINTPYLLGYYHLVSGDFDDAIKILKDDAEYPEVVFIMEYHLALAYKLSGDEEAARHHFEKCRLHCDKLIEEDSDFDVARTVKLKALAFLERLDECAELIKILESRAEYDGSFAEDLAKTYAICGNRDRAYKYLEKSLALPRGLSLNEAAIDPVLRMYGIECVESKA